MCTINDDGTIRPCGGMWPEGSHEAAWHPHANCPVCAAATEATHRDVTMWFVANGSTRPWSNVIDKFMREFRVLRKEKL